MRVLVVNAGSSSLKLSLLDGEHTLASTTVERWQGEGHLAPITAFLQQLEESGAAGGPSSPDAVGHRVVHGGPRLRESVLVSTQVLDYLASIEDLAPLHNPRSLAAIDAVSKLLPDTPAVACFDTTFHARLPAAARTYALPRTWNEQWQLRRYGFHGLSHAHAVRRGAALVGRRPEELRVVSCHLGAGASLAAVRAGEPVDTTMGFTPLEGLVMATRSGSVDPGLLLWLLVHGDQTPATLAEALEHSSGLRGLSGTSGDLRDVIASRDAGDPDAALALEVFVHRLRREIGAMTASAGGLDLLVLTGGIGENSAEVRASVADGLRYLGVELDPGANRASCTDRDISAAGASVRTVVVAASEETEIARETRRILAATDS